jgi:thioredoxin-related protein
MRKLVVSFLLVAVALAIGFVFWKQELKYATPTPVPERYQPVPVSQVINVDSLLQKEHNRPVHLHFYNPDCPCSKFNTEHFITLTRAYLNKVDFYIVVPDQEYLEAARQKFEGRIPVLADQDEKLAEAFGVYSTPQAVLIDAESKLYYRGNYNRSRYCTDPATNYAQLALEALLAGKPAPQFNTVATTAYGCELTEKKIFSFSIF